MNCLIHDLFPIPLRNRHTLVGLVAVNKMCCSLESVYKILQKVSSSTAGYPTTKASAKIVRANSPSSAAVLVITSPRLLNVIGLLNGVSGRATLLCHRHAFRSYVIIRYL